MNASTPPTIIPWTMSVKTVLRSMTAYILSRPWICFMVGFFVAWIGNIQEQKGRGGFVCAVLAHTSGDGAGRGKNTRPATFSEYFPCGCE